MPTITDYLSSLGKDSSYGARSNLASQYGIKDYTGTANQNNILLGIIQGQGGNTNTPAFSTPVPQSQKNQSTPVVNQSYMPAQQMTNAASKLSQNQSIQTPVATPWSPVPDSQKNQSSIVPVNNQGVSQTPVTLSNQQSQGKIASAGLAGTGIKPTAFQGMTNYEATNAAEQARNSLLGQTSQNTSFSLNSDFFNKANGLINNYGIGVKDAYKNPWDTTEDKVNKKNTILDSTTTNLANLIGDKGNFDNLYNTSPEFKKSMDQYVSLGGSIDTLRSKIPEAGASKTVNIVQDYLNADGTRTVKYSDGTSDVVRETKNQDGTVSYSPIEQNGVNLASGNPLIDKLLSPQTQMAQQNIEYLKSIPEQYRNLYFGDTGYFTKQRQDAEASLEKINQSFKNVEESTSSDFDVQKSKNEADAKIELAKIEENRADSQNYLTGMLAKLGALTTTGESSNAVAKLNQKYDQLASTTNTNLTSAQSALASDKAKTIAGLEQQRLEKVSAIKSDISKSAFEIQKEILSVEKSTKEQISNIISDWQKQAASINKSFIDKQLANKNTYEQLYFKAVSGGMSNKILNDLKQNQPLTVAEAATYGVPYGTTYGQLSGKTLTKPLTDAQSKDALYASRIADAEKVFSSPNGEITLTKISPAYLGALMAAQSPAGGFLGNIAQQSALSLVPEAIKSQFQAQRNLINAILRKESGAAISQGEFDNAYAQYLPQAGDTPAILEQKKQNRQRQYQGNLAGAGATGYKTFQNVDLSGSSFNNNSNQSDTSSIDWANF